MNKLTGVLAAYLVGALTIYAVACGIWAGTARWPAIAGVGRKAELALCKAQMNGVCSAAVWQRRRFAERQTAIWSDWERPFTVNQPVYQPGLSALAATMSTLRRHVRQALWFLIYTVWPRWDWVLRWRWWYLGLWVIAIYTGFEGRAIKRDTAATASAQVSSLIEIMATIMVFVGIAVVWWPMDIPIWLSPLGLAAAPLLFTTRIEHWARSK